MNSRRIKDLAERVVGTFVGAFVAVYFAAFAAGEADLAFLRDPGLFEKAQAAGVVATLALFKGLWGFRVGDKNTASLIPSNKPEVATGPSQIPEQLVPVKLSQGAMEAIQESFSGDQPQYRDIDVSEKFQYWYKEEGA